VLEKGRVRQFLKDAARLEDPITDLTGAFVQDLNQLADTLVATSSAWNKRSRRILLFFDTFEQLAPDIVPWLLDHFLELEVSSNIVLVIAGRDSIELSLPDDPKRWLPLLDSDSIHLLSLNVFTEEETRIYLVKRGITDAEQMCQIYQLSRGLPLYLSMLTTNPEGHVDPTAGVVENFLRWIPKQEAQKRQLALNAALFSLPFTKDDITAFSYSEPEKSDLYHWLIGQPFIQYSSQDRRYIYHDIARNLFCRYLYQRSQEDYYAARRALVHFYQRRLEALQAEGSKSKDSKSIYTSRSWKELVFALIQQVFLLADEEGHLLGIEYVLRMYEYTTRDSELIRILNSLFSNEPEHQATTHAQSIVQHLLQYMELDPKDHYQQWVAATNALLEIVSRIPTFPSDVIAYLYRHKGRVCRLVKDYQNALVNFNHALDLLPNYATICVGRGLVYRFMERYEEAVADFARAIALDKNDTWALAQRGETYRLMGKYEEAVADFARAIVLDENNMWVFAQRGETYRLMGKYEEAVADFAKVIVLASVFDSVKSIALDDKDMWTLAQRGGTYRLMERYEEAVADFDKAIALDENNSWALASRGLTYRHMGRYEEALADFARAIALDENNAWALARRGEIYLFVGKYEEAAADFDRTIALDKNGDWNWYSKAIVYLLTDQKNLFHDNIHAALKIGRSHIEHFIEKDEKYYRFRFNVALYLLVDGSREAAEDYRQLLSMCSMVSRLQSAVIDLEDFLTVQPANELAQNMLTLIKKRIEEVKRTRSSANTMGNAV
jgi:tetratricopeptide (TPR) repeat protein